MKALAVIAMALLMVGCEGGYRYECQDPENWGKSECQRPECEANGGICTDVLVGATVSQDVNTDTGGFEDNNGCENNTDMIGE
jgi:hypothetical protein